MYALSEAPTFPQRSRRAHPGGDRVTSTGRPFAPALVRPADRSHQDTPRAGDPRPSSAVFRRRRLVAGSAVVAVTSIAVAIGGGGGRMMVERLVGLGVVVLWASCAVALWRSNRSNRTDRTDRTSVTVRRFRSPVSGVEPGVSCLAPGSASVLGPVSRA